jgi:hypothetical protein
MKGVDVSKMLLDKYRIYTAGVDNVAAFERLPRNCNTKVTQNHPSIALAVLSYVSVCQ